MIEIRWHGRGGQGAITAAKIFATAAFRSGYTGVVMAPTFGTERRGAPVFTSLKLAKEKIYDISPIETPDIVVVLDHLLLTEADVTGGLKPGGLIVLNTPKPFGSYDFDGHRLAVADITALSVDAGLPHGRVNSGIIGSLCKAFDVVPFETVLEEIEAEFQTKKPQANSQAAKLAYDNTALGEQLMGTRGYRYKISLSESGPGDGGRTGSWRVQRPVLNTETCTPAKRGTEACFICWLYCPDNVISRSIPPVIDYEYCKGCGICAEECPTKAITMIDEAEWHEGDNEPEACSLDGARPCT